MLLTALRCQLLGILESTLNDSAEGFCVQGGLLEGLATATIDGTSTTANDTVYVKAGGGLTMTKPTGTGLIQNIAKVVRVHASNGSLVVSSILRTNDVPNLTTGKIWVGDGNTTESTVVHLNESLGRMGIGTDSPTLALDVRGTQGSPSSSGTSQTGSLSIRGGGSHFMSSGMLNVSPWTGWFQAQDANNLATTYPLALNPNGGNVGIGTDSPGVKLDVDGTARIKDYNDLILNGVSLKGYPNKNLWLIGNESTNVEYTIGTSWNWDLSVSFKYTPYAIGNETGFLQIGQLQKNSNDWTHGVTSFYVAGSEKMRITSAGGISFGSTGTAYGTSGQILKSNANASPTWVDASTVIGGPYVTIGTAQTITAAKTFTADVNVGAASTDGAGIHLIYSTTVPEIRIQAGENGASAFSIYNTATSPDAEQFFINNNLGSSHLGNARGALKLETSAGVNLTLSGSNATFAGTVTAPTFLGDLNGTINTATTGVTQTAGNNSTLIATTAYADAAAGAVPIGNYLPLAGGLMTGAGNITMPDNFELRAGTDSDLRIYNNGTNNFILNTVGNLNIRNTADDANITFQSDDGSGGYTSYFLINGASEQTQVYKDFRFQDDVKAKFGNTEDLQIYHDGSNSFIQDAGTGFLVIDTNGTDVRITKTDNELMAKFVTDAQVELYYNGSKKFETTSTGVSVTGDLTVTGDGNFTGTELQGDNKTMLRYSDSWLRINDDNDFVSGIYCGTGILRTDGDLQVGSSGTKFLVTSAGAVTAESTLTLDNGQIVLNGTGRIQGVDTVSANTDAANKAYVDDKTWDWNDITTGTPPTFNQNTTGNAATATSLPSFDTRSTNPAPNTTSNGVRYDFKTNTTNGLSDGGTYNGQMTWRSYSNTTDLSGGMPMNIAYTANGNLWTRIGATATTWGTWYKLWSSGNDGAGSGLDADLLDGQHASAFQPAGSYVTTDTIQTVSGAKTFSSAANHYSGHLYYDPYDSNGNHYPHFNDGANGNGVNVNWRLYQGSNLITHGWSYSDTTFVNSLRSTVEMRAPIFYDSNNTAYYGDFHSRSVLNSLQLGNASSDTSNLKLDVQGHMAIRDANGLFFGVSSNNYNSWTTKLYASGSTQYFNAQTFIFDNQGYVGTTFATINVNGVYAPRFYDSDNTAYYLDPASTSNLNNLTVNGTLTGTASGNLPINGKAADSELIDGIDSARIVFGIGPSKINSQSNANSQVDSGFYENAGGGTNWPSATWYNSINVRHSNQGNYHGFQAAMSYYDNNFWFRSYQGSGTFQAWEHALSSGGGSQTKTGILQSNASFRAPIFYDSDNTSYYLDPASTSVVNDFSGTRIWAGYDSNVDNSISCSDWFRSSGSTGWYNASYGGGIHMIDGTWVRVYNNKRFFVSSTAVDSIYTNGGVKADVEMSAPIFYDSDNTSYYINPGSGANPSANLSGKIIVNTQAEALTVSTGYGTPSIGGYFGALYTSSPLYVGSPIGAGEDLYCDDLRSNIVFDRVATAYYFEGGNTGDSIRVAGDVVAYYSSDERLKDNIKPIENALQKVNAIRGVTFEWNEKSHKTTGKKDIGVVAQEIEAVLPELVETRTNGYKAVDYQKLTAVLIESVKELTAKVEALEAKQCNCK
jgi:hypothetical protein